MIASVFVGTSLDGFIARPNGAFDFLPADGGEPHGFEEFLASVDAVVMGRNTFDIVLPLQPWPYGDKRVVVLSSRPLDGRPNGVSPAEGASCFVNPLTALGMVIETVSRTLTQLKESGVISMQSVNRIKLVDRDALEEARGDL